MTKTIPAYKESRKAALATLTVGHMVYDFYGLVLPFLLPPLMGPFDMSFAEAGLLAFAAGLMGAILQLIYGFLGGKFTQRKPIIICGFLASIIGLLLVGTSTSYSMLVVAWFVYGFGAAAFYPQSTNFVTNTHAHIKRRAMGFHGIGGTMGSFLAALLIAYLAISVSWRYASFLFIIPGIIAICLVGYVLREPQISPKDSVQLGGITPSVWVLALTFGLIFMAYKGFLTFLPLYLRQGSTLKAGYVVSIMLFIGFIAQPIGGYLYNRIGGRWLFMLSAIVASSALMLPTILDDDSFMRVSFVILGIVVAATFPVALTMAIDIAGDGNQRRNISIVFGLSALLSALSPVLTGYWADSLGIANAIISLVIFPFAAIFTSFFLPSRSKSTL